MRIVVNAVSIRDGAILLLLQKEDVWILPGGKQKVGESYHDCLRRELREELPKSCFEIRDADGEFEGLTPHGKEMIRAKVFNASIDGDLTPGAEISESRYVTKDELPTITISQITRSIIDNLITDGRL